MFHRHGFGFENKFFVFAEYRWHFLGIKNKKIEITHPEVVERDGIVRVEYENFGGQRPGFTEFGGQQQTSRAEQLELRLSYGTDRQESVEVVHR